MFKCFFTIVFFVSSIGTTAIAQTSRYTVSNAHSHNDYVHPVPFYPAYHAGFGSIEADIFLFHDQILIGHDSSDLAANRTLEGFYLKPLDSAVRANQQQVFADPAKKMILLIDIKTAARETLDKLISVLQQYPRLIGCSSLRFVITGNRPLPLSYPSYPAFIWFDGILSDQYGAAALSRIVMMSDNLKKYTSWSGKEALTSADEQKLNKAINSAHQLNKPVRFWNAPDTPAAWVQLIKLQADYINTDHIPELAAFLNGQQ